MALSDKGFQKLLKQQGLTSIQKENYNVCMQNLSKIISENHIVVSETETIKLVSLEHDDFVRSSDNKMKMTPCKARSLGITYDIPWYLVTETINKDSPHTSVRKKVFIGRIPVMVRSILCSTNNMTREELYEHGEDPNDQGGYFIIDGIHEKHTILQDQLCLDWLFVNVFPKIKKLNPGYEPYQTKSTVSTTRLSTYLITINTVYGIQKFTFQSLPKKDDTKESVNVLRIFRLMGMSDIEEIKKSICNFIPPEERDKCMNKLSASIFDFLSNESDITVMTSKLLTDDLKNKAKNFFNSDKTLKFRNKITDFNTVKSVQEYLEKIDEFMVRGDANSEKVINYMKETGITTSELDNMKKIISNNTSGDIILTNKEIKKFSDRINDMEILTIIDNILYKDLFPQFNYVYQHIDGKWDKKQTIIRNAVHVDKRLRMLSYYLAEHLRHEAGYRVLDDLNSWSNKRVTSCGFHFMQIIRQTLSNKLYNIRESLSRNNTVSSVLNSIGDLKLEMANIFNKSFLTQTWLKIHSKKVDSATISYTVKNTNYASYIESMYLMIAPVSSKSSLYGPREVKSTSYGFIGPERTPDSSMTGLTKFPTCCTLITTYEDTSGLESLIAASCSNEAIFGGNAGCVILDGITKGWHSDIKKLRLEVIRYRRATSSSRNISVVIEEHYLKIETGHSRLIRPLAIVDLETQTLVAEKDNGGKMPDFNLQDWLSNGWMEYISPREQEHIVICADQKELKEHRKVIKNVELLPDDLTQYREDKEYVFFTDDYLNEPFYMEEAKKRLYPIDNTDRKRPSIHIPYTHMEMHPTALLTVTGNLTVWPNHNQGPRNTYNAGMSGQALSRYNLHFREFMKDGMKTCITSTFPLVRPPIFDTMGLKDCGFGCTMRVAIMLSGSNQEDGTVISRSFLERGGFRKLIEYVKKCQTLQKDITVGMPDEQFRRRPASTYHGIYQGDDTISQGLPMVGAYLKAGDCILARRKDDGSDASEYLGFGEEGVVTNIHVLSGGTKKTDVVKIKMCKEYIPVQGDKYSPRNAQKGVCCLVLPEHEMPFTETGPIDVLFTSFAFPTRMTISMIVEMIAGRFAAASCKVVNSAAHSDLDIKERVRYLNMEGYRGDGYEKMFSSRSGMQMSNEVYVGEVFYQALHHLAMSKIQGRSTGPISASTRQPIQGGRKGGGPKLGDMSMKALLANGLPFIVQERTMYESDLCNAVFCGNCGIFAERKFSDAGIYKSEGGKKVLLENPDYKKAYICRICNKQNFYSIPIPHGLRLIIHYLIGMGIKATMNIKPFSVESSIDTFINDIELDQEDSDDNDDSDNSSMFSNEDYIGADEDIDQEYEEEFFDDDNEMGNQFVDLNY